MKRLMACFLFLAPIAPLSADDGEPYFEIENRVIDGSRPIAISIPQSRIETSVEIGRIAPLAGGGIIGGIILRSMDRRGARLTRNAANEAEEEIAPLLSALDGFEIDSLAAQTSSSSLSQIDWFSAGYMEILANPAGVRIADFVEDNPSEQLALVEYRYQLSPDFTHIRVIAKIEIASNQGDIPLYNQRIISISKLDRPSFIPSENVERWSANDGLLAKSAINAGFSRIEQIIPLVIGLGEEEFDEVTDKKRESAFGAGFHGPILMRDELGPVIWARKTGFISIQTATEQAQFAPLEAIPTDAAPIEVSSAVEQPRIEQNAPAQNQATPE